MDSLKIIRFNKLAGLYVYSSLSLFVVVYIVPFLWGYSARTWAEFYQLLGQLIGIWGLIFGGGVILYGLLSFINYIFTFNISRLVVRCTKIELILLGIFLVNIVGLVVGILRGEPLTYVFGDTLKGSFIPLFYLWAKHSLKSSNEILQFTKLVLVVESLLFISFSLTDLIPFAQSTRTFLYTVAFTLFYEEDRPVLKAFFLVLTLFALFIVMTTGAFRGTVIIFMLIVILNYVLRYQSKLSPFFSVIFIFITILISVAVSLLDVNLEKNVSVVSKRFESTIENKNKKNFGLEESVFQRVGETIDVVRSYQREHPVYLLIGFGNGAMLENILITPSEYSVYKSNVKHNIYITLVGIFFRHGLIGLTLYLMLFGYLIGSVRSFYRNKKFVVGGKREYVYLKVLILYHLSVVLYSFVAYLFIGNVVVAFTMPLHIMLRNQMEQEARTQIMQQKL